MPALREYDIIVINSSAGKDSQAMLTNIVEQAHELNITDRLDALINIRFGSGRVHREIVLFVSILAVANLILLLWQKQKILSVISARRITTGWIIGLRK